MNAILTVLLRLVQGQSERARVDAAEATTFASAQRAQGRQEAFNEVAKLLEEAMEAQKLDAEHKRVEIELLRAHESKIPYRFTVDHKGTTPKDSQ